MKNLKNLPACRAKHRPTRRAARHGAKKIAAEFSRMMQSADMKKLILLNFPYIIAFTWGGEPWGPSPLLKGRSGGGRGRGSF